VIADVLSRLPNATAVEAGVTSNTTLLPFTTDSTKFYFELSDLENDESIKTCNAIISSGQLAVHSTESCESESESVE
jgi:hypothetical protein